VNPANAGLRQRVIEQQYWLTASEMADLLGLSRPPAGAGLAWRGHQVLPVAQMGKGPPLWSLTPGATPTTGRFQLMAGAAAGEWDRWLPLAPAGSQVTEVPPLLMRAVVGWVSRLLPLWLPRFGWSENGRAHLQLWIGPTSDLGPGRWPARPAAAADCLALAIALAGGAEWQVAEGSAVLHAGDVVLASDPPTRIPAGDPAPLWLAGWVIRQA
jgi:hypothetical protein